jgi:hypothetical protein
MSERVDDIAQSVSEYAMMQRHQMIQQVANGELINWWYEYLAIADIDLDPDVMVRVREMAAAAMFRQQAYDTQMWSSRHTLDLDQLTEKQAD